MSKTETTPLKYIYVKIFRGHIYDMWGGEPNCVGFTTDKDKAERIFGKGAFVKIELCEAQ